MEILGTIWPYDEYFKETQDQNHGWFALITQISQHHLRSNWLVPLASILQTFLIEEVKDYQHFLFKPKLLLYCFIQPILTREQFTLFSIDCCFITLDWSLSQRSSRFISTYTNPNFLKEISLKTTMVSAYSINQTQMQILNLFSHSDSHILGSSLMVYKFHMDSNW